MIQRATPAPRFRPGDLVRHVRYDYRGVVVAADPVCRASAAWYAANRTQPDREQPWYHVLVHGAAHSTYAAQTSLTAEPDPQPVEHPLVAIFFERYESGRHVRNHEPWPDLNG